MILVCFCKTCKTLKQLTPQCICQIQTIIRFFFSSDLSQGSYWELLWNTMYKYHERIAMQTNFKNISPCSPSEHKKSQWLQMGLERRCKYTRGAIRIHSFNYASKKAQAYPHDSRCVQNAIRNKHYHINNLYSKITLPIT